MRDEGVADFASTRQEDEGHLVERRGWWRQAEKGVERWGESDDGGGVVMRARQQVELWASNSTLPAKGAERKKGEGSLAGWLAPRRRDLFLADALEVNIASHSLSNALASPRLEGEIVIATASTQDILGRGISHLRSTCFGFEGERLIRRIIEETKKLRPPPAAGLELLLCLPILRPRSHLWSRQTNKTPDVH